MEGEKAFLFNTIYGEKDSIKNRRVVHLGLC